MSERKGVQTQFKYVRLYATRATICRPRIALIQSFLIWTLLTYMATIQDAIGKGVLESYGLPDWERRQPIRPLYVATELFSWVDGKAELYDQSLAEGGRLLVDHLDQMFCDFRCAERPRAGDIRRMLPTGNGIWKIHPPGLRVYGWVPAVHSFVAVTAALEAETKDDKDLNNAKMKCVQRFARKHSLEDTILRGDVRAVFP